MFAFSHQHHKHLSERGLLIHILDNQNLLMADLTKLTAAVAANTDATNAAVKALGSSPSDQPAVDALAAQVDTNTAALVAATPAAPVVS